LSVFTPLPYTSLSKKIVRINLENSFPLLSPSGLKIIEQEFYHHFCDVLFEAIRPLQFLKKTILKRFKITNPEVLEAFYPENRSIMLFSAYGQLGMSLFHSSLHSFCNLTLLPTLIK